MFGKNLDLWQMESPCHHQMSVNNSDQPPSQKRRHLDEFDDEMNQQPQIGELQAYQPDVVKGCSCVLQLWKEHTTGYPSMSCIVRNVLWVMPTSAANERNFSLAGHVVSARKSTLKSSSVNNVLFMNSAIHHNKQSLQDNTRFYYKDVNKLQWKS